MRPLVLGSSGFLGSWTVRALRADGLHPMVLVRPGSDDWRLDGVDLRERVIAPPADWPGLIADLRPDVVIGLDWAGVGGADKNDPSQWANLDRLEQILGAVSASSVSRFVGVGSQAEYGPREGLIREDDQEAPVTEYGKAKRAARDLVEQTLAPTSTEWVWARVFSTYGPLDHPYWLLPGVAGHLMRGEPVPLTLGLQRWSYLHGADAGRAFSTLARAARVTGVVHVGSPRTPRLRDVVEQFAGHFRSEPDLQFGAVPYGPSPVLHLEPDLAKLAGLGWEERVGLEDGLAQTAAWWQGVRLPDPLLTGSSLPLVPWALAEAG